ncbi:MAG TPA: hypothetical protein VMT83_07750 [Burkholderiaceae bacterium]|nr:hypothetical protein [Burkholderiaceae bacterium]
MNFSTDHPEAEGGVVHEPHAAVVHRLQHAVLYLVQTALDNARAFHT